MRDRAPYVSLNGIADGSNVRRDLSDKLHEIGAMAAVAIGCVEDRELDDLVHAVNEVIDGAAELPRLHSRVANWERVFGPSRKHRGAAR